MAGFLLKAKEVQATEDVGEAEMVLWLPLRSQFVEPPREVVGSNHDAIGVGKAIEVGASLQGSAEQVLFVLPGAAGNCGS